MIAQPTVRKALSMRDSGMSWPAIADTLDCNVDDLAAAVKRWSGKTIPAHLLRPGAATPPVPVASASPLPSVRARSADPASVAGLPDRREVGGFVIERGVAPPVGNANSPMTVLANGCQPGDCVRGLTYAQKAGLMRLLLKRGLGAAAKPANPPENTHYNVWVFDKPTARQVGQSEVMRARHTG